MQRLKKKSKVFLDASCLIAAVLSPAGGSFTLINKSIEDKLELCLSEYVLEEAISVLREKYPQSLMVLTSLLGKIKYKILPEPILKEVEKVIDYIDFKDTQF